MPEIRPGVLAGYLPPKALPNSLALTCPPPAAGSAALAHDEEVNRKSLALRGTPRWKVATEDANLIFPQAAGTFSCACLGSNLYPLLAAEGEWFSGVMFGDQPRSDKPIFRAFPVIVVTAFSE